MTEDTNERRRQILRAALAEFAAKGFRGATIKSIAQAADLQSPTLIYWYFPTKEALFQAVLEELLPLIQATADPTALYEQPPEVVLTLLARSYLGSVDAPDARQLVRLMLGEMMQRPELAGAVSERVIPRVLGFLGGYFELQIERGRFRPHDTRSSARMFMGMLIPLVMGKVAFPALRADGLTEDQHIATAIDIFLRGLTPGG
jgi:AcrR family transcriptional regulator